MSSSRPVAERLLLVIILVAFAIRLVGIFGQGLPYSYYPDERAAMQLALSMGANRTLNPQWFNKPALSSYVLLAEYGAFYAVGRVTGLFSGPEDFGTRFFLNESEFLLIGRFGNVVFGALSVWLTFLIGRRLAGRRAGLLAAALLAVSVGHIDGCQEIKEDVQATFWSLGCLYFTLKLMDTGRLRHYVLAGLFCGLGIATKYWPVLLVPIVLLAHILRGEAARRVAMRTVLSLRAFAAVVASGAGFFLGSPYNFLSSQWYDERLSRHLTFMVRRLGIDIPWSTWLEEPSVRPAGGLTTAGAPLWDSLVRSTKVFVDPAGGGPLLAILVLLGLATAIGRGRAPRFILAVTFVWSLVFLSFANQVPAEPRHLMVLYPVGALLGAVGFLSLAQALRPLLGQRASVRGRRAGLALGALVVVPLPWLPTYETIAHARAQLAEDPRSAMLAYVERTLPAGAVILNDHRRIYLVESAERVRWVQATVDAEMAEAKAGLASARTREERAPWRRRIETLERRAKEWHFRKKAAERTERPRFDAIELEHEWMNGSLFLRDAAGAGYSDLWPRSPFGRMVSDAVRAVKRQEPRVEIRPDTVLLAFDQALVRRFRELEATEVLRRGGDPKSADGAAEIERNLSALWARMGGEWPVRRPPPVELWRHLTPVSERWLLRDAEGNPRPVEWMVSAQESFLGYVKPERRWHFMDFAAFYEDLLAHYDSVVINPDDEDENRIIRLFDLRRRVEAPKVKVLVP